MSLNPKQQRFVDEYLKDLNATQAAIRAGYSKKTARQSAAQLLSNINIKKAIKVSQKSVSERTEITQELVLNNLYEIAIANGKNNVAVRCWELIGKHLGMFIDKLQLLDERELDESIASLIGELRRDRVGAIAETVKESESNA